MSTLKQFSPVKWTKTCIACTIGVLIGCQVSSVSAQRHVTILELDEVQQQDPRQLANNAVASGTFSADGLFHFNKATLKDLSYYQEEFERLAQIAKSENLYVRVDAFADKIGTDAYNLKLSQQRAKNVANYLTNHLGIPHSQIVYTGWGERYPVVDCDTSKAVMRHKTLRQEAIECLKPNRRVTISVVK